MNDLFYKIAANIRYVDNLNGTVTLLKSDFESLVKRVEESEKDNWEDFKKRNDIKNSAER